MLRSLRIAVTFLTPVHLPISPPAQMSEVGRAAWAFPVVGAAIGLVLVAARFGLAIHLADSVSAVLIVGLWIFTGGLHLDGWADCCDALPTAVPLERRREILKDSRIGTFGVLGLILLLALKVTALAQSSLPVVALFIAPVTGRSLMVICASRVPGAGEGMGGQFVAGLSSRIVFLAAIFGLIPAAIAGANAIIALVLALIGAFLFTRIAEQRLGIINGDVLGAVCELSETIVLVTCSIKW